MKKHSPTATDHVGENLVASTFHFTSASAIISTVNCQLSPNVDVVSGLKANVNKVVPSRPSLPATIDKIHHQAVCSETLLRDTQDPRMLQASGEMWVAMRSNNFRRELSVYALSISVRLLEAVTNPFPRSQWIIDGLRSTECCVQPT